MRFSTTEGPLRARPESPCAPLLELGLLPPRLDLGQLALVFAEHPVEEVDHLGRVEERVEAVVGAQLQELAELLRGAAAFCFSNRCATPASGGPPPPGPRSPGGSPGRAGGAGSRWRGYTRPARTPPCRGRTRRTEGRSGRRGRIEVRAIRLSNQIRTSFFSPGAITNSLFFTV